jgi:uncharacterized protein YjbI with pentapeptide repeats
MAREDDPVVRSSIYETLGKLDTTVISEADRDTVFVSLVRLSRILVEEGDLRRTAGTTVVYDGGAALTLAEKRADPASAVARAKGIADVIVALARGASSVSDLTGIYCASCDFRKLNLSRYKFSKAILHEANFSGSLLNGSSFDDADLTETNFESTDLRDASFRVEFASPSNYVRLNFVRRGGKSSVYGPHFQCADLRRANFEGHPILRFHSAVQVEYFADSGPSFQWANLEGADLRKMTIYGVSDSPKSPLRRGPSDAVFSFPTGKAGISYYEWPIWREDAIAEIDATSPFTPYLTDLPFMFHGANWSQALLPTGVRELLERLPDSSGLGDPPKDCLARDAKAPKVP